MKAIRTATNKEIKQLSEQIVREFQPQKIILFGSHANGEPMVSQGGIPMLIC